MPIKIEQSINNSEDIYVKGLDNESRLHMFNVLKNDTTEYYFNIFKTYTMPDSFKNDSRFYDTYVVDNADWWDNISAFFYDTSTLWWLVCFTNDIINPYEDIYPGKIIKVFKKEYFNIILNQIEEIYKK